MCEISRFSGLIVSDSEPCTYSDGEVTMIEKDDGL